MSNELLRVGVLGATGYTGAELLRLILQHPRLRLSWVGGRESAGRALADVLPGARGVAALAGLTVQAFEPQHAAQLASQLDVMFTALPHGASASAVASLYRAGLTVVDLSADFRLNDTSVYTAWYDAHPHPELLAEARYGLPELHREALRGARLIACPGCYPTSALLPLAPLLGAGGPLVAPAPLIVDSKTGVSGAGKKLVQSSLFCEVGEGLRPYKVAGSHRHTPEIEQELSRVAGRTLQVTFTPQLAPLSRGILTVAYAQALPGISAQRCTEAAEQLYREGLVSVLPPGELPDTLHVRGSARAHVGYALDQRTGLVLAMCAIDNLARGSSAQALQSLNVSLGWPDALGLPELPLYP